MLRLAIGSQLSLL